MTEPKTGEMRNAQGLKLWWRQHLPEGAPRSTLLIVHGYAEHGGRYGNVVDQLLPQGCQIFVLDLQGHGKSEGERGYVERLQHYVDEVQQFRQSVVEPALAGTRLFVLGHSMGSIIAMHLASQKPEGLAGLVLSGTGTSLAGTPRILTALASLLSSLVPHLGIKSPHKNDFISHDPAVVEAYGKDPLVYAPHITVRLGAEMYQGCLDGAAAVVKLTLPLLMVYGSEDTSFSGQQDLFDSYAGSDKKILCYQGSRHEVFNEIDEFKKPALAELGAWIQAHLS